MPAFLEAALKHEASKKGFTGRKAAAYVYGTLNNIGAMHGNKETRKGAAMQAKHNAKVKAGSSDPKPTRFPHPRAQSRSHASSRRAIRTAQKSTVKAHRSAARQRPVQGQGPEVSKGAQSRRRGDGLEGQPMSWDLAELMREARWYSGRPEELTMCQQKLAEPLSRDEAVQRLKDLRSGISMNRYLRPRDSSHGAVNETRMSWYRLDLRQQSAERCRQAGHQRARHHASAASGYRRRRDGPAASRRRRSCQEKGTVNRQARCARRLQRLTLTTGGVVISIPRWTSR